MPQISTGDGRESHLQRTRAAQPTQSEHQFHLHRPHRPAGSEGWDLVSLNERDVVPNDGVASPHGKSMRTMSELSRKRSKTICLPSGVTSNVRMLPLFARRLSSLLFPVLRSRSQKSWDGPSPCM
jgi:hypothetical protein